MKRTALIGAALLIASPLAFAARVVGVCETDIEYKDKFLDESYDIPVEVEVKAKCDGYWTFSADIDADVANSFTEVFIRGNYFAGGPGDPVREATCSGGSFGDWSELKKYKVECDGKDIDGLKTKIDIEIKTKEPKEPK